jgi:signal transduction histidine kinase
MRAPSIRRALLVRCCIGVGLLLVSLSTITYFTVSHGLYDELDLSIRQTAALLANQIELEDGRITFEWEEGMGTNRDLIDVGLFQYWNEASGIITRSPGLQSQDLPRFCGVGGTPLMRDITLPNGHHARAIGMRVFPFVLPAEKQRMLDDHLYLDPKTMPHILVVARDAEPVHRVLARMRWILGTGTLLTLAVIFMLIDQAVRVSLNPIESLTRQIRNRAGNHLNTTMDVPHELPTELTGLALEFDSLLARAAVVREREQDFIRHAAHELRTPIAGLLATTELALSKSRAVSVYVENLESCRQTARELSELVKRLSALARIGSAATPAKTEPIDLDDLLDECLPPLLPLFSQRNLNFTRLRASTPPRASGDPVLARMVFNNLLENAAAYATYGGEVVLRTGFSGDRPMVVVSNPVDERPQDLDRLFEPLFRCDRSRSSAGAHLGIGLTLSLNAVQIMGGTLTSRMSPEGWIEFVIEMPPEEPAKL